MENTDIKKDQRYWASGVGATDTLTDLAREHFTHDEVTEICLKRNYYMNTGSWRPSDALRQAISDQLRKG